MGAERAPSLRGLYALTPDLADTRALVAAVEAALAGGVRWVQYRNKAASPALRRQQASVLQAVCARSGAILVINDDLDLACEIGAGGVHLGAGDGDAAAARARLGPEKVIGISCYASIDRALQARAEGADYVAFGAVFPSPTKPAATRAPLALLTEARQLLRMPVAVIGGITLANAPAVIAAGGDLLAVITDLFGVTGAGGEAEWLAGIKSRAADYQRLFA